MPLKPIFDKAPLTAMNSQALPAGLVRMESAMLRKLYAMTAQTNATADLEGTFRLACIVNAKPEEEPVTAKIRALLDTQKDDGAFAMSLSESVQLLRAAWALYEYAPDKALLEGMSRWFAYAAQHLDALAADDALWEDPADLLELLENFYRVTGKTAVLTLCERISAATLNWAGVLNTVSSQRPTRRTVTRQELTDGLHNSATREDYYPQLLRTSHAEKLADGARGAMAKGWRTGSATELNAARNGWERLSRYHGAICGGLTSDALLEGTSPAEAVSTAALGAWAESLCAAAKAEHSAWAWDALERMAFNAMPACLAGEKLAAYQRVNALTETTAADCFLPDEDHDARALNRLTRGYAALASSAVSACNDGAAISLYLPGRYAVPVGDGLLVLTVKTTANGATVSVHCKQPAKATLSFRVPAWSVDFQASINDEACGEKSADALKVERDWQDGDVITLTFGQALQVAEGHHQGRYVLRGPVVMALDEQGDDWRKALVSAEQEEGRVSATVETVKEWKLSGGNAADIPVLPETAGDAQTVTLTPYARAARRIALFPGRKQA